MIGILDYGMGNLQSVSNAIDYLGYDITIANTSQHIEQCSHLIVPGVGYFHAAMENLTKLKLNEAILTHINHHKPLLGICLGMQILANEGFEHGHSTGLNLIPGAVKALDLPPTSKIPHVGWNNVTLTREHPLFHRIKNNVDFYFVHSFYFDVLDDQHILGKTTYATKEFASCVMRDNIVGLQFHPEKSQDNGLKILKNFCEWNGAC